MQILIELWASSQQEVLLLRLPLQQPLLWLALPLRVLASRASASGHRVDPYRRLQTNLVCIDCPENLSSVVQVASATEAYCSHKTLVCSFPP